MRRKTINQTRHKMIPGILGNGMGFILIACFIGTLGCASAGRLPLTADAGVPLPDYQEGTTFVYSNGHRETVHEVTPDRVVWQNHRGDISAGSPDFTYRRTAWETRTRSGTRSFRGRNDWLGNPTATSVWPLAPGKTARYIESGRWQDSDGKVHTYNAQWRSEVAGQMRVRVKAGEFDTWKIIARRFSSGGAYSTSRVREVRIWYYAPAAGHYVKMERNYLGRKPNRVVELVAITPPVGRMMPVAQGKVQTNFQQALEENKSGDPLQWAIPEHALSGATMPVATMRLRSGTYCRQYRQQLNQSGEDRAFFGLACRTTEGTWQVPHK
jgi:hypothetical protein